MPTLNRLLIPGLLLALGLAACGTPSAPLPTPVVQVSAAAETPSPTPAPSATPQPSASPEPTPSAPLHPLSIEAMRALDYPGSDLVIEEELTATSSYRRYYASYLSEGLKIYGLLTVPRGAKPASGWPVIIFNHGYIPPRSLPHHRALCGLRRPARPRRVHRLPPRLSRPRPL